MTFQKVLLVGCGNMAGAMVEGWLAGGIPAARFTIVDPVREIAPGGIAIHRELPTSGTFDVIMLGVKPQMLGDIAAHVAPLVSEQTVVLSLLAGVELATLRRRFASAALNVRVMPNLAVALGKAPIGLAADREDAALMEQVEQLLQPLGTPHWVGEDQMDLVTALAGSGPAFVYRFIDALKIAAVRLGLPEAQAAELALAMVEGAATLVAQSKHDPGSLADMVASKGGTTRAGLDVLDKDEALIQLMHETLRAARDRSVQMAREARD